MRTIPKSALTVCASVLLTGGAATIPATAAASANEVAATPAEDCGQAGGQMVDGDFICNGTISVPPGEPEDVPQVTLPTLEQVGESVQNQLGKLPGLPQEGLDAAHNLACAQAERFSDQNTIDLLNCG